LSDFSITYFLAHDMQRRQVISTLAPALLASAWLPAGAQNALKVGKFTSEKRAYNTHSYWIEGSTGLVLIDTQFLPSDTTKFVDLAEKTTGKKAVLAVVLHPNPDKFNGTATLQARGIKVVTSQQVLNLIPAVHVIRTSWFYDDFKPDYPKDPPKPDSFGSQTTALTAGGVSLKLHVLGGAGCSGAHVVAQVDDAMFVGDLLASQGHAWMELALFDDWLQRLDELKAIAPKRIYTGRGPAPTGPELIEIQRNYLQTVRRIVLAEQPSGDIGYFKKRSLKNKITEAFPSYDWDAFVWEALPDIWRKLGKPA
jgi:glyoxylase-like metal-dependent hydrolase (beta-lactamase superfamily II)